jgi:hypothetical protein
MKLTLSHPQAVYLPSTLDVRPRGKPTAGWQAWPPPPRRKTPGFRGNFTGNHPLGNPMRVKGTFSCVLAAYRVLAYLAAATRSTLIRRYSGACGVRASTAPLDAAAAALAKPMCRHGVECPPGKEIKRPPAGVGRISKFSGVLAC